MNETHPSLDQLAAFDSGRLRPADRAAIEAHVAGCNLCCRSLEGFPGDELSDLLRTSAGTVPFSDSADTLAHPNGPANTPSAAEPGLEVPRELREHPRYRILGPLGAGGMGTVFKAEHRLMERVVALKVLRKGLIDRPDAVERFRQEVKAAARLSHPNIVAAFDADRAGDVHFLVMEFVEGESLDRLLRRRGPLPVALACHLAREAARGLQHAGERGMVHRDVKPANLMRTPDGGVKILDFGLARFASESLSGEGLTPTGAVVGTPDYVAPEQALDPRRADVRADVYGLGCTLYQLLTGQPPFTGGTALQVLIAHRESPPRPITELRPDVPPELARIVDRMLAKDPARRYQTPAEVVEALAPFDKPDATGDRATIRLEAPPRRPRKPWRLLAGVAALLIAVGGAALAWQLYRDRNPPEEKKSYQNAGPVLAPHELRRIGGPEAPFTAVAFAPDCRRALTAGTDHVLRLWDLETGKELARFEGHTDTVLALAFSPDGRHAVSGSKDHSVRLWDLEERKPLGILGSHLSWVRSVAFTLDGERILAVPRATCASTFGLVSSPLANGPLLAASALCPRKMIFSAGNDLRMNLWRFGVPHVIQRDARGDTVLNALAVNPKGHSLALARADKVLHVWEFDRWKLMQGDDMVHGGAVTCATYSADGNYLLSGSGDQTLRLWRVSACAERERFEGHGGPVTCAALSGDLRHALSGSADRTVRLWEVYGGRELVRFEGHEDEVLAVAFCPDGRRAVSGGKDGTLRFWELPEAKDDRTTPYTDPHRTIASAPDGNHLIMAGGDEQVKLLDMDAHKIVRTFKGHASVVVAAALTPDGKTLATGGWDRTIKIWDVASGKELRTLSGHTGVVRSLAFASDGKSLVSGGGDGTVRLWDVETGKPPKTYTGHRGTVRCVAIHKDGKTIASGGADGTVRLWDVATGVERASFTGHEGPVNGVALATFAPEKGPRAEHLASAGADGTVKLWDLKMEKATVTLLGHEGPVWAVLFGPDGRGLFSAGQEGTVRTWDAAQQGRSISTLKRRSKYPIYALARGGDEKQIRLVGRCADGEVIRWEITPTEGAKP
jgi:WD40 repeat protein